MNKSKGPHQAKNKVSDATNENDFEVVGENSADERNTVIVDKDFENLEFDDRVWLWWRNNKISVIAAVIASIAIIVIVNGKKMLDDKALLAAQTAYNECGDQASLESFAKEYSYSELAGLAALQVADAEYTKGDFEKAKEFYTKALSSLKANEIAPRAAIGLAFSELKLGETLKATELLKSVSQSEKIGVAYKSEAIYQLAILDFSQDKKDSAKALLESIALNPMAGIWANQAQAFIRSNY